MKYRKVIKCFILCLSLAGLSILMLQAQEMDLDVMMQERIPDEAAIVQKLQNEGEVNVILNLDVPDIRELTRASTQYKVVKPGELFPAAGINADMALNEAISNVSNLVLSQLNGTGFTVNHTYSALPFLALKISADAYQVLLVCTEVKNIWEDKPMKLVDVQQEQQVTLKKPADLTRPDDPKLTDTKTMVEATNTWAAGYTGSGWYVAILDTGIRSTHEMFGGKTILEACYSNSGHCPNGLTSQTGTGAAAHYPNTYDGWDHGTHVAGIAAGNNGSSVYGMAKDANLIAVQVFSKFDATTCGGTICVLSWSSDQLAGLNYVYSIRGSYSIASVNMSIGGGSNSSYCDTNSRKAAVDNLLAAGIATCIASGNNGYCGAVNAPGCISTAVTVGSVTKADAESSFNNWHGTIQDLFAPGSSIYSATGGSNTSYAYWSGTSMATPHVAGAWALIKQAKPAATVSEIQTALENTGVQIASVCSPAPIPRDLAATMPGDFGVTIPRIKIFSAIQNLLGPTSKDDLLGTWSGQGVYYRNSDTTTWNYHATHADKITAGDLDGDNLDDLIGIWSGQGGVWVKYSSNSSWALLGTTATWIATGDMNGDGREDLVGSWSGQGVYYRNSADSSWNLMATAATQVAAGDLDNDGTDDLVGIWSGQGGVWAKFAASGSWALLGTTADWITAGDMNGDDFSDLVGSWSGQGVYYRDSKSGAWTGLATPATQVAAGDLDGDGTDDLIGIWAGQGGVWLKKSSDGTWELLSTTADWITAGRMRSTVVKPIERNSRPDSRQTLYLSPPDLRSGKYIDLREFGPGGKKFRPRKSRYIIPGSRIDEHQQKKTREKKLIIDK